MFRPEPLLFLPPVRILTFRIHDETKKNATELYSVKRDNTIYTVETSGKLFQTQSKETFLTSALPVMQSAFEKDVWTRIVCTYILCTKFKSHTISESFKYR